LREAAHDSDVGRSVRLGFSADCTTAIDRPLPSARSARLDSMGLIQQQSPSFMGCLHDRANIEQL